VSGGSRQAPTARAAALYREIVMFLLDNGLRREELGSGWWHGDALQSEAGLGEAVELLLAERYQLDLRKAIPGEPEEFWG
jgi:hypothetical protein